MRLISVGHDPDREGEILIVVRAGWFRKRIERYTGNSTVWHNVVTGRRPGTLTESWFANLGWQFQDKEKRNGQQ